MLVLVLVIGVGVLGFRLIESYSWMESFYMTIITISTVGFKEVRPLSDSGQLFTSVLIISSFGTFAYGVSLITGSILSGELGRYYKLYRLEKEIHKLKDHVIICGFGRNGRRAAKKLEAYGQAYVIIEKDEEIIKEWVLPQKLLHLQGDATLDEVLHRAGIEQARALISTLSEDAANVYTVITARQICPEIHIITRASSASAEGKLRAVGANHVVMPEGVGGAHMATLVVSPDLVEFLDSISVDGSSAINLQVVEVRQLTDHSGKMRLTDLALRQKTGCSIIGLRSEEGETIINPDANTVIMPNSKLFVLGKPEEIKHLYQLLQS